jgi:hypothetical protein
MCLQNNILYLIAKETLLYQHLLLLCFYRLNMFRHLHRVIVRRKMLQYELMNFN